MKKIVLLLFLLLINIPVFSQNYPIKTIFKGDSVVIMTTDQFEGIDLLLSNQKERNLKYKRQIDSLQQKINSLESVVQLQEDVNKINTILIDSLHSENMKNSIVIDSIQKQNTNAEKWFLEAAIDNAWMYYDWTDSTIKCVDLTLYGFWGNKFNGRLVLFRRYGSIENPDIAYWKQVNRDFPQILEPGWNLFYRKKRRLSILNYPNKIIAPYKPKEVIITKMSDQ